MEQVTDGLQENMFHLIEYLKVLREKKLKEEISDDLNRT